MLLPKDHIANSRLTGLLIYLVSYILCGVLPLPIFVLANSIRDSKMLKEQLVAELHVHYENFNSDDLYLVDLSPDNIWTTGGLALMLLVWFLSGSMIVVSTIFVYNVLHKNGHLSNRSKRQHKLIFAPLVLMVYRFENSSTYF